MSETLEFKGHTIRALPINGVPWFALPDLLSATGLNDVAAEVVARADFSPFAKTICDEEADDEVTGEPEEVVLLSPVGVLYWALSLDPYRLAGITAWARREARRLCPNPTPGDPAMYLTLTADTDGWTYIPPGPPPRFSGWNSDYDDLKWSNHAAWCAAGSRNRELRRAQREGAGTTALRTDPRLPLGLRRCSVTLPDLPAR